MTRPFFTKRLGLVALAGAVPAAIIGGFELFGIPMAGAFGAWAGAMATAAGIDISLAPTPSRLSLTRRAPARANRHETVPVLLELQNLGPRELRGGVRDVWPRHADARPNPQLASGSTAISTAASKWAPLQALPGERIRIGLTLAPKRRGTVRSDAVAVRSVGPLGLAGRETLHALPSEIAVAWRPKPKQLGSAEVEQRGETQLAAVLPPVSGDENTATVIRAFEELRLLGAVYGGRRAPASTDPGGALVERLAEYLPQLLAPAEADHSGRLIPLIDHLSDLFTRAQQQGNAQQQRLLVSRYANTLTKLTALLSEDYYGDLLRNPEYWSDAEMRRAQVLDAVAAVDNEVLENIQQLSESRDIEFKVAIESLTRPQRTTKLSDIYGDGAPASSPQPQQANPATPAGDTP